MPYKIIFLILLFCNLNAATFSNYIPDKNVDLKISYLNMNHVNDRNIMTKDRDFFKKYLSIYPMTIFNSVKDKNLFDYFASPTNIIYSVDQSIEYKDKSVFFLNNNVNEFFNIRRVTFLDDRGIYTKNNISGFVINKNYVIYVINFADKYDKKNQNELIENVKNLYYVINFTRKELHIKRSHIAFIGSFGLSSYQLKQILSGFRPALTTGTKIVKKKNKYRLSQTENVLLSTDSVFSANIDFFTVQTIRDKRYSKKNLKSYIQKVSPYYPIILTIKNIKLKKHKF